MGPTQRQHTAVWVFGVICLALLPDTTYAFQVTSRPLGSDAADAVVRPCAIVHLEQQLAKVGATSDEETSWVGGTRWRWNGWGEVTMTPDGWFVAPAFQEACKAPGVQGCTWKESGGKVHVSFGAAGQHTLTPSGDRRQLTGARDMDGDPVVADRV
eukprot:m.65283 g.65283  ORF g.65283 m.65283 type:complete len:156 (-) comp8277_c0_seq2:1942-2409(-)